MLDAAYTNRRNAVSCRGASRGILDTDSDCRRNVPAVHMKTFDAFKTQHHVVVMCGEFHDYSGDFELRPLKTQLT